jgi:hypothetical protein
MAVYDTADPFNRQDPDSTGLRRRAPSGAALARGIASPQDYNPAAFAPAAAPAPAAPAAPRPLRRGGGEYGAHAASADPYVNAVDKITAAGGSYGNGGYAGRYRTADGRTGQLPLGVASTPYTAPDGTRTNAFAATARSVATAQKQAGQQMSNVAAAPAWTAPAAPADGGMQRRSTSGDLSGANRERQARIGELSAAIDSIGGNLNMASKRRLYADLIGERDKLTNQYVDQQTGLETFGVNQDNEGQQFAAGLAEAGKRSDMEFADRSQERLARRSEATMKYRADTEQNNIKNLLDYRKQQLDEGRALRDDRRLDDSQVASRIDNATQAYIAAGKDPLTAGQLARQDAAGDAVQAGRALANPELVRGAQDAISAAAKETDNTVGGFIRDKMAGIINLPTGETLPSDVDPNAVDFRGYTGLNRLTGSNQTISYGGKEFAIPDDEAKRLQRLRRRSN